MAGSIRSATDCNTHGMLKIQAQVARSSLPFYLAPPRQQHALRWGRSPQARGERPPRWRAEEQRSRIALVTLALTPLWLLHGEDALKCFPGGHETHTPWSMLRQRVHKVIVCRGHYLPCTLFPINPLLTIERANPVVWLWNAQFAKVTDSPRQLCARSKQDYTNGESPGQHMNTGVSPIVDGIGKG